MKVKQIFSLITLAACLLHISSCSFTATTTKITFPKIDLDAPSNQQPVRISEMDADETVQILVRGHYTNSGENSFGNFPTGPDSSFSNGFRWRVPESQAGFEFEYGGKRLALLAGLNYSKLGGRTLWQRYLGAGFKLKPADGIPEVLGIRFDATAYYNDVYHDSNYLATTSTTTIELVGDGPFRFPISRTTVTTTEHSIFGKDQYLDGSVTATFNTIGKNWPINYFATGTFGSQTFIKITHDKKNHGIHRNYSTFPSECTRS